MEYGPSEEYHIVKKEIPVDLLKKSETDCKGGHFNNMSIQRCICNAAHQRPKAVVNKTVLTANTTAQDRLLLMI